MKRLDEICVVVQSRLSSQRVPNKMLKFFAGHTTLFDIACEKMQHINLGCYVSVFEPELIKTAKSYDDINIHVRSKESAHSDYGLQTMYDWWGPLSEKYKYVVMFNACLPFLKLETIGTFIHQYSQSDEDGMFAVYPKKDYFWSPDGTMLNDWPKEQDLLNTKAVAETLVAAHALYGGRITDIGEGKWMGSFQDNEVSLVPINESECLDIDYPWEFEAYSQLYQSGWRP